MPIYLASALIVAVLVCTFALQNAAPIAIKFLFWHIESSMALVLIVTFALGAVFGLLACIPAVIKNRQEKSKPDEGTPKTNDTKEKPPAALPADEEDSSGPARPPGQSSE